MRGGGVRGFCGAVTTATLCVLVACGQAYSEQPVSGGASSDADAKDADLSLCDGCKLVFVTSEVFAGTSLGTPEVAATLCRDAAARSRIPTVAARSVKFMAWLSVGNTGATGVGAVLPDARYVRPDGAKVCPNKADLLDGDLDDPILMDENGLYLTSPAKVWTGTQPSGRTSGATCASWRDAGEIGDYGVAGERGGGWTLTGSSPCATKLRLYCFEGF